MTTFTITVNSNQPIQNLHIHVDNPEQLNRLENGVSALTDAVAAVQTGVNSVLSDTAELVKDVQRLIADGNTAGATTALNAIAANLADAQASLAGLDVAVETADPEPVTPPTP